MLRRRLALPALLFSLSCSSTIAPQGGSGGMAGGGTLCPGIAVECPADTVDYCLPGAVPVDACCYATSDGRHVPIGLCPRPDAGAPSCGAKEKVCGDACVTVYDPATGCALASCEPCSFPHALSGCGADGACSPAACASGYSDCDGEPLNGCEANTGGDPLNCGKCGAACPVGTLCDHGVCH